jgi:hypothetical protein
MPSTAAQILVTIIPIVGIVTGGVLIFFFLLWAYRERRLLIEKNLYVRKELDVDTFSLFAGIVLLSIGLTLVLFFLIKEGLTYELLSGLVPFSLGVSLTLFFIIRMKMAKK